MNISFLYIVKSTCDFNIQPYNVFFAKIFSEAQYAYLQAKIITLMLKTKQKQTKISFGH